MPDQAILDGEVAVIHEGRASFSELLGAATLLSTDIGTLALPIDLRLVEPIKYKS